MSESSLVIEEASQDSSVLLLLQREFYANKLAANDIDKVREELTVSVPHLRTEKLGTVSKLYVAKLGTTVVGFSMIKFYNMPSIAPQLFFRLNYTDFGTVHSVSLVPFFELLPKCSLLSIAAELAYMWVDPAFRAKGIGTHLFKHRLDVASKLLIDDEYVFVLAKDKLSETTAGYELLHSLLAKEKLANGVYPNTSYPIVKSINFPMASNSPLHKLSPVIPVTKLLERNSFEFFGLSRNLSSVYASKLKHIQTNPSSILSRSTLVPTRQQFE